MSTFIKALTSYDARTQNNALSHSTSGSTLVDYFAKCGSYRNRDEAVVFSDMASIFGEDRETALKLVFYNRLITRKPKGFDKVQRGQGNRDEFIKSIKWLENNHPDLIYPNLWLIPVVGCWKDLWYDSPNGYYHYIDPTRVYQLVAFAIGNPELRGLVAKYLPKYRSQSKVKNERHARINHWVKKLILSLGWTERDYRKFKSDPDNFAHQYQRDMCSGNWNNLNFNTIPGKALLNINKRGKDKLNTIERHNLTDKYLEWIKSKPVANFTGYVYELYNQAKKSHSLTQKYTYDAQFNKLLSVAKQDVPKELLDKGVLCALDTSGSMSVCVAGNTTAVDICVSLGIFFSSFLKGEFKDNVVMFDSSSKIIKLTGNSFTDKIDQISRHDIAWGSTNFQSVIDEIIRVRQQNPQIPVQDYPKVLLVVSDMAHNPTGNSQTNYEFAMSKLRSVGLPEMSIIWWQVNASYEPTLPNKFDDRGVTLISGFDPSIVTSILGGETVVDKQTGETRKATPEEQMNKVLDQEVLKQLQVV